MPPASSILFLTNTDLTVGLRSLLETYMRRAQIPIGNIVWVNDATKNMQCKAGKTKMVADMSQQPLFFTRLQQLITKHRPKTIVINDTTALKFVTNKYSSLDL